jgi:hypothetical protein
LDTLERAWGKPDACGTYEDVWEVKEVYIGSPELEPQVRGLISIGNPVVTIDGVEIYDIDGYREYLWNNINVPLEVLLMVNSDYEYYDDCESGIRN